MSETDLRQPGYLPIMLFDHLQERKKECKNLKK